MYKKLVHAQASAIEHITLVTHIRRGRLELCKTSQKFLKSKFKGVKRITWFIEGYAAYGSSSADRLKRGKELLGPLLPLMESLPLQRAKVAVTQGWSGSSKTDALCLELAEEIEQKLVLRK